MKVIKLTGLVPVKALVRHKNIPSGKVFGVTPEQARAGLAAGDVELYPVPDGVETYSVADLIPAAPVEEPAKGPDKKAPVKGAADSKTGGDVEIPENWQTMQWLKQAKLAKQITGADPIPLEGEKPAETAKRVISEEVQRRAAAVQPPAA